MKIRRRILGLLLAAALLLLSSPALAAEALDPAQGCSLTVSYQDGSVPLVGAGFSVYLVATADESGAHTATETFARYPLRIQDADDAARRMLASTLEGYTLRDCITPTGSGITDSQGMLRFPDDSHALVPGLYLVLGTRHRQGGKIYDAQPFLVQLPMWDEEKQTWNYDAAVAPKFTSRSDSATSVAVTYKVLKVWEDDGHEKDRPEQIEVDLLRDGAVYDTVTLNAANNWRYVWENLDGVYRWLVVEKEPGGYTVEVTQEGTTFVVTNTWEAPDTPPATDPTVPEPTPGKPSLPQTGQLWWPVPLLVCGGLLLIVVGLLRRRGDPDEA